MRVSSIIVVGYISLNGWISYLNSNGFYDKIGAESVSLASDMAFDWIGLQSGAGTADQSLFGVFRQGMMWFSGSILDLVAGFPALLISVGAPASLVATFIGGPISYIMVKEAFYVFSGRDL